MPTGQVLITNALVTLGLVEQGGSPSSSDSTSALNELNDMWNAWGVDEGIIYAIAAQQFAWTANTASNAIGPSATSPFNVPLPSRIYSSYFVPASGQRIPLDVVDSARYHSHRDLTAAAKSPDELYADWLVDPTAGTSNLYLWPVPNVSGTLELETGANFTAFALATNYNLPNAYQDAINWNLAYRLIPQFGVAVLQQTVALVTANAEKSQLRIREMNRANRQLPPGSETLEPAPEQQQPTR